MKQRQARTAPRTHLPQPINTAQVSQLHTARKLIQDVFIIPIGESYLLYSPLRGIAAELNLPALDWLFRRDNSGDDRVESGLVELKASLADCPAPPTASKDFAPSLLGIIPTRGCNMSCVYCDFGSKTPQASQYLPLETAQAAVDWYADQLVDRSEQEMKVHFFGGEPLVAFDSVKKIVEYSGSVAAANGLNVTFELTTNGNSDEDVLQWVGRQIDTVVLSLDGPSEIHDRQRPARLAGKTIGTFERAVRAAQIIGNSDSDLYLRCCATSASVLLLPEIVDWFCREFHAAGIDIEPLQPTPQAMAAGLTPPEPFTFAKSFYAARAIASNYGVPCSFSAIEAETPRCTLCPVGADGVILDVDGSLGSCYLPRERRQSRLNTEFGRITSGGVEIDFTAARRLKEQIVRKPRCEKCFCRWSCAGGCHVSVTWPGCSDEYDDFCRMTRILTACLLLESLGQTERVEQLLRDDNALHQLADHPSDLSEVIRI